VAHHVQRSRWQLEYGATLMAAPRASRQISYSKTVTAPIGGLNAFNSISNMPESDAVVLRNFFPEPFGVRVRKGYREHATGLDGDVCTLMRYNAIDGTTKLFAVDQVGVYDVTTPGDYSLAVPVADSTNPWWQCTNSANPAGTFLIAFNGKDDGLLYDGTAMHSLVDGNGTDPYTWSGIDPKLLVQPIAHQHRIWAVEKDTTRAWYLPPEQLWGVAESFDFGGNFNRGGYLQALTTYTYDSGYGPNDYLAAISSAGEVSLYKGIDPNSAADWALIGVFYVGATFTRRCTTKFGGDFAMLTQYGMVTMNSVMSPASDSVLNNALSQKIQYLISEVTSEGSYRAGWDIHTFASANFMMINVPGVVPEQTFQLVYNTLIKAWTIFEGMVANCWVTVADTLAYGSNGKVYRAWEGTLDEVLLDGSGGHTINAEAQQAFSYFQEPGANKHYKMFRPTFLYSGKFKYRAGANMNFDFATQPPPASFSTSNFGVWNTSLWDEGDVWAGGSQSDKQWVSITGIGYAASIRIGIDTSSETVWVSTDWLMEKGGVV
jgi:hypothetical protein